MSLLSEALLTFLQNTFKGKPKDIGLFVAYKIVDSTLVDERELYTLQCINTNAVFKSDIHKIVSDTDLLYYLHPIQACYIGIEYGKLFDNYPLNKMDNFMNRRQIEAFSKSKFLIYSLSYIDRRGSVCFLNEKTNEQFIMDPRDIALSKNLVEGFDAAQAFYIGLLAGFRLRASSSMSNTIKKPPFLKVVT